MRISLVEAKFQILNFMNLIISELEKKSILKYVFFNQNKYETNDV